jgi:hypothetical protein
VDLARQHIQGDVVVGQHGGILLANTLEAQQRRFAQAAILLKISFASIASTHLFTNILNNVPP